MTSKPLWPAEHVTELRRLIEVEKLSATEAAAALPGQYSRNSVIGKCKRMGIRLSNGNGGGRIGPKGGPSMKKPYIKKGKAVAVKSFDLATLRSAHVALPQPDPLHPGTVPLLELSPNGCRYPSDQSDDALKQHLFCNRPQFEGLPYCGGHARIAYRVDERRRV